jgi:peroxidase
MANISEVNFQDNCPKPKRCDVTQKYRRMDGSCNNLKQPKFGWRHTPFQRILPNAYADGNFKQFY